MNKKFKKIMLYNQVDTFILCNSLNLKVIVSFVITLIDQAWIWPQIFS